MQSEPRLYPGTASTRIWWKQALTLSHVPTQVTEAVQAVERERGGEDGLVGVLDGFGQAADELYDVRRAEGLGRDEVCERVAVQHWELHGFRWKCGQNGGGSGEDTHER